MAWYKIFFRKTVTTPYQYVGRRHKDIFVMPAHSLTELEYALPYRVWKKLKALEVTRIHIVCEGVGLLESALEDWHSYGTIADKDMVLSRQSMRIRYSERYLGDRETTPVGIIGIQSSFL